MAKRTLTKVELAAVKVGFYIEDERLLHRGDHHELEKFEEALSEELFKIRSFEYRPDETHNLISGYFFVVEFNELPTPELLAEVKKKIESIKLKN